MRADGVKGVVIASSEILVTCARRAVAAVVNKGSGEGASGTSADESARPLGLRDEMKRSQRVREVDRAESRLDVGDAVIVLRMCLRCWNKTPRFLDQMTYGSASAGDVNKTVLMCCRSAVLPAMASRRP